MPKKKCSFCGRSEDDVNMLISGLSGYILSLIHICVRISTYQYAEKTQTANVFLTLVYGDKTITGDSLYHDNNNGNNEGFGNVVFVDHKNKNELHAGRFFYRCV